MKIFYCCLTGTLTSLVAANYHLGVISHQIDYKRISNLPNFDCLKDNEIGQPIFVGIDELGNELYTFGVKDENILLTNALIDWLEVFRISNEGYKIIDLTNINVNYLLKAGIFLSMKMGFKGLGRLWGAKGLKNMLPEISDRVDRVKMELA